MTQAEREALREEMLQEQQEDAYIQAKKEKRMHEDLDYALEELFNKDMTVSQFTVAHKRLKSYGHDISPNEVLEWIF
jgi:hypothetical protein